MTLSEAKEAIREIGRHDFQALIDDLGEEVVEAGIEAGFSVSDIEDVYEGEWDSDEDFVQEMLEGCGDIPKGLPWYIHIDWEATARDVMMDYTEWNGHYFRNG